MAEERHGDTYVREWVRILVAQNAQEEREKTKSGKEKDSGGQEADSECEEFESVHVPKLVSSAVEGLICGNNKLCPCRIHYCCNRSGVKGGRICCRRESMKSVEVGKLTGAPMRIIRSGPHVAPKVY
jgi:hypothetical protein